MKASTLKNRIAKSLNVNGSEPKNMDYQLALDVINGITVKPNNWKKNGRYVNLTSYNPERYLRFWGVDFETGNDAPRGGKEGYYVKLTTKGKRQVADYLEVLKKEKIEKQDLENKLKLQKEEEVKNRYANIKSTPFFELWNSQDLKDKSGKSWNQFRNDLKIANPEGWAALKLQFKSN
jgi:hypothetical protein